MDITNIISYKNNSDDNNSITSSNYNVSDDKINTEDILTDKNILTEENINDILEGNFSGIEINHSTYKNINDNEYFNTLNSEQQTLILNRIYDKLPKTVKNTLKFNNTYFYCKCCGYNEIIKNKSFIYSKNFNNDEDIYNCNFKEYINDNTLPSTKKYNCINPTCETHKNPSIKKATFYRFNKSYKLRYICSICNSYWFNI